MNLTSKLIAAHLLTGEMVAGSEISIRIDRTLTQDSTGTMAYLQFEAIGVKRVKTKRSIAYIDHNTLQTGFENADDHKYIQTVTKKHGIWCSKPGNGICHQVNVERFGVPGDSLLGSDSHTPSAGGIGMLAIGAGGLDVAVTMGGGPFHLPMPKVVNVRLSGRLPKYVAAKDIILEILRRLTVKGGVGKVMEYTGEGLKYLSVPERATICNMGAELGATTSVFPSDEVTREFLRAQKRERDFTALSADEGAEYDETIDIDLSTLVPLVAKPHMPDVVDTVENAGRIKVDQVCIGSCTNSSYLDMMRVASILRGKTIAENVSLVIAPGSKQVLHMLASNGALADMIAAGARIEESACGFCIGMGQSPCTGAVSLRTSNRNFYARSGTKSAGIYLVSCETAAASAISGVLTDPRTLSCDMDVAMPKYFDVDDSLVIKPAGEGAEDEIEVVRGPNIKPFPAAKPLAKELDGETLIKMEDNITTDHIMPSNAKLLPYRSNIPYLADFCLNPVDESFAKRAKEKNGGFIVAGQNYGQGSSREHAALAPLYLGIKAVIAKSFARIHMANLINNGILPLTFKNPEDYDLVSQGDSLKMENAQEQISGASDEMTILDVTAGRAIPVILTLSERQKKILLAGGLLNFTREENQ